MTKTVSLYSSSIGRKIISALTGLFLCAFLVVHISGNMLLFKNDGGQAFNEYATSNATNLLMRTLEIGLFAGFCIHIFWGIQYWFFNRRARPQQYSVRHASENSDLFSRIMLLSGSIVLLFLVVHLRSFWVPMRFARGDEPSLFLIVQTAFQNPLYDLFYIACLVLLAYHLRQGFQSAFQTLGIRPGWRKAIKTIAIIFWLIIPVGFASIPAFFLLKGAR
jgi:succinate dehydrogenase / fumarate reductase, cytochrome b subunit